MKAGGTPPFFHSTQIFLFNTHFQKAFMNGG
jgi:hypothetical protein